MSRFEAGVAAGQDRDELMALRLRLKRTDPKCPELLEANDLLRDYQAPG